MHRRELLRLSAALAAARLPLATPLAAYAAASAPRVERLGPPARFDYAWLKGHARWLAGQPHKELSQDVPPQVRALDWDRYQAIRYREERGLWVAQRLPFQARFFHLGLYYPTPVQIHEVVDGRARKIAYSPELFAYGERSGLQGVSLPKDLGFAGFRVHHRTDFRRDVAAFLGASYFRAVGSEKQYGLSARGLAIDCGMNRTEEFPSFTAFWLQRPAPNARSVTIHALLESRSTTGAYRFDILPGATLVMDVDAALYPRKPIERIGIAPLTSMYQTGENDRRRALDWRPEIHDSDGLAMWTGAGEWIWRALVNPPALRFNAYADHDPRGFGLLQRDRNFDHYQDDGVFYDRRPSLWVEPRTPWGKGSVQLVEIPTDDETLDNIVAFWNPAEPVRPGGELLFSYRLHWGSKMPFNPTLAHTVATRTGIGGIIGKRPNYFSWRFTVDFAGGTRPLLPKDAAIEAVVSASSGELERVVARVLAEQRGYRATFDIKPAASDEPVNLRMYLTMNARPLTETWLYQWSPPPLAERRF